MKRIVCMLMGLVLCLNLAVTTFAAEKGFVPSISYKPGPELVPTKGPDGNTHLGVIRDGEGNVLGYVEEGCLRITPVAEVWEAGADVPENIAQLLRFVYEQLKSGQMQLPYEKHNAELDPAEMVIRDLFDVRWSCQEHRDMMNREDTVLELTFALGVEAETRIFAMSYDEETGDWSPILSAVNNGDGTVTCSFAHLCAIAFSMPVAAAAVPVDDAPGINAMPWIVVMTLSAVAAAGIAVGKGIKKKAAPGK